MATEIKPANAVAPVFSAEDQFQINELTGLIEAQRRDTTVLRAGSRELRVMLYGAGALMIFIAAFYVLLPVHARLVTTYVTIVALVLSGWGIYRSMRAEKLQPAAIGRFYALAFGLLTVFYLTMLLSLTHAFDPGNWVK